MGVETLNNSNGKIIRMAGNGIVNTPEPARKDDGADERWVYYPEKNNYVERVKPVNGGSERSRTSDLHNVNVTL